MKKRRLNIYGEIQVILSGILFGMMPILAKDIYKHGGNAYVLVFLRFLFGGIFLFFLLNLQKKETLRVSGKELGALFILSVPFVFVPLLLFSSYQYISSGLATTLHFCYPVLVILLETLVFKIHLTGKTCICCVLCVIGIILLYEPDGKASLFGIAIALLSGVFYAVYILCLTRSRIIEMNALKTSAYLSGITAVEIAIISLILGKLVFVLDARGWGMSILLAMGITSFALVAFQRGAGICGAQKATLLSTSEPLTSIALGAVILNEELSLRTGIGICCILLSILLLVFKESKKEMQND